MLKVDIDHRNAGRARSEHTLDARCCEVAPADPLSTAPNFITMRDCQCRNHGRLPARDPIYFMDAELGLVYLRVSTWCPFLLQFYCNGHSWLACKLTAGIDFVMAGNAFVSITDWQRAQALANAFSPKDLHRVFDRYAARWCPVLKAIVQSCYWSVMQIEYSTDLVFRSQAVVAPLYEQLTRQAVLCVKAEHAVSFLGHKITLKLAQEVASRFATRIEGTCIKHRFGKSAIKMYDKFALILRLETTSSDVSSFKHHRKAEHRKGPATRILAPVKKSIYRLPDLREILAGCNRRYLVFLSALDDFSAGVRALDRLIQARSVHGCPVDFFWTADRKPAPRTGPWWSAGGPANRLGALPPAGSNSSHGRCFRSP